MAQVDIETLAEYREEYARPPSILTTINYENCIRTCLPNSCRLLCGPHSHVRFPCLPGELQEI